MFEYLSGHPEMLDKLLVKTGGSKTLDRPNNEDPKVVSLAERQLPKMRQKIRTLEKQLYQFLENSKLNHTLWKKLLNISLALIKTDNHHIAPGPLAELLCRELNIEECKIFIEEEEIDDVKSFAQSLSKPVCQKGFPSELSSRIKMDDPASSALVPIRIEKNHGLLIFVSSNRTKYRPDDDVEFLENVGALVAAAITKT